MSKWKCEICNSEFDNYQAQGFNGIIYCPLCYFKELYKREKQENERLKEEYKNKLDKTLEVLQYELQFQTGGCYHRLSNLFDYLQNGSDSQ